MCSCKIVTTIFFELPVDDISHLYLFISHLYFLLTAVLSENLEVTKHQGIQYSFFK